MTKAFCNFASFICDLIPFSGFFQWCPGPENCSVNTLHKLFNSAAPSLKSVRATQVAVFLCTSSPNLAFDGTWLPFAQDKEAPQKD